MFTGIISAIDKIKRAVDNKDHITVYGDYDADGLCSVLCFKDFFGLIGYTNFTCVEYTHRIHLVDPKVMSYVIDNSSKLCLICDTGSSDLNEITNISKLADVIIADHHLCNFDPKLLNSKIAYVNPTVLDNFYHLSGACVVYEICMAYINKFNKDMFIMADKYLVFYAYSALYSDSIYDDNSYTKIMRTKALRCIVPSCMSHLKYFNISKRFSLYSFAPPINACFRNNKLHILNKLYLNNSKLLSVDKQKLLSEMSEIQMYSREAVNIISTNCTKQVIGNFVLVDLSGLLNQSIPNAIIWDNKGLIANKIAADYKSCCICVVSKGSSYAVSIRDYYNRDILKLFSSLYNVGGHKSAFGGTLSLSEIIKLKDNLEFYSNTLNSPSPLTILEYNKLSSRDIQGIADKNEYLHPKDLILVRLNVVNLPLEYTPDSFSDRYEQYKLVLSTGIIIYIKLEDFGRNKSHVLIHFFNSTKLKGEMVRGVD